jgi:DMSO/TMAO reductase YedYZ molybdopterin-dependent catalytic subunit
MLKKLPVLDIEGPPLADPRQWQIKVVGLVESPATFGIQEIREMEPTEATMPIICVEGWDLPAENGGPLRLVVPFKLAYKSVKWVTRIEFVDSEEQGYWEIRGYPPEAGIPDDKREEYGI